MSRFEIPRGFDQQANRNSMASQITGERQMVTSRSELDIGNTANLTIFGISEILQRNGAYSSVVDVMSSLEAVIGGGLASVWDVFSELPGISSLIPEDIQKVANELNPQGSYDKATTGFIEKGETASPVYAAVLQIAVNEIGTRESANKRTKYGSWYGLTGYAWSAMFLSWCFNRAGFPRPAQNGQILTHFHNPKAMAEVYRELDLWSDRPVPGSIAFMAMDSENINHCGIVEEQGVEGKVILIEGDTREGTSGTQHNGGGVYRKNRRVGDIVGFGTPPYGNFTQTLNPGPDGVVGTADDVITVTAVQAPSGGSGGTPGVPTGGTVDDITIPSTAPGETAWAGSRTIVDFLCSEFASIGLNLFDSGDSATSPGKRSRRTTAGGSTSDHYIGNRIAYAEDWGNGQRPTPEMDAAAISAMAKIGEVYNGTSELVRSKNITIGGNTYRVQILYRTQTGGNHENHIHTGVKLRS